jgi:lipoxygenase
MHVVWWCTAESGVEKTRVTAYAHKTLREGHYEAEFKVPASFGPVGAVLVENEHHKEVFIKEIKLVTGGDSSTAVTFDCNSWVHSKFDNPEKRIFFTLKVRRLACMVTACVHMYAD